MVDEYTKDRFNRGWYKCDSSGVDRCYTCLHARLDMTAADMLLEDNPEGSDTGIALCFQDFRLMTRDLTKVRTFFCAAQRTTLFLPTAGLACQSYTRSVVRYSDEC